MARTKVPVPLRIDPEIKAAGEARAKEERRSFASFLEWLIVEDGKRQASTGQSAPPAAQATARKRSR